VCLFGKLGFVFAGAATMWKPSFYSRDLNQFFFSCYNFINFTSYYLFLSLIDIHSPYKLILHQQPMKMM
jgi:hypothetical protein